MGAFFLWVRRRGFAPAPPSRFPARSVPLTRLFSTCVSTAACHSSPRDPSDAKRARKTWRFGVRGMRERKRERESDTQRAGVRFFFCAPFSTHGKARYDGPCRQSRLMLAKQQVSRLHSAGETDVFGPEVCASERERVCERCPRRRHAGVGDASLSASLSARRALLADSPGSGRYQRRLRGDNPPDSPPSPDRDRRGKRMSKRTHKKKARVRAVVLILIGFFSSRPADPQKSNSLSPLSPHTPRGSLRTHSPTAHALCHHRCRM